MTGVNLRSNFSWNQSRIVSPTSRLEQSFNLLGEVSQGQIVLNLISI